MQTHQDGVTISDPGAWQKKIDSFRAMGINRLQVISDWDRTLTDPHSSRGLDQSTYSLLHTSNLLGSSFSSKSAALYNTYRQIELSTEIDVSEKFIKMDAWWTAQFDLLTAHGFGEPTVRSIAERGQLTMRDGVWEFLRHLHRHEIPLLILSAGIANIIEARIRFNQANTPNVHICANRFPMAPDGLAMDFARPLIHTLNKSSADNTQAFQEASANRTALIVLGDTLEDIEMKKLSPQCAVISIGFLCDPSLSEKFLRVYDAVIAPDGSFAFVNELLAAISSGSSAS